MNIHPASLAHAQVMEWTNDDALELIEQYRHHTELWNRSDPKYKDKLCRFRAWSEIAERFGCSKAEVERKMNVLLTQYRREKHKMLVKLYQGIHPNPSKWYAFKRFDFMEAGGGSSSGRSRNRISSNIGNVGTSNNIHVGGGGRSSGHVGSEISIVAAGSINDITAVAAAAYNEASSSAASGAATAITSHQKRLRSREMKYFGAMGLNLPMLITNTQTLDSWNTIGQLSPPFSEHKNLRIPLSHSFVTHNDRNYHNIATTHGLFGSSNSDPPTSPQKLMDLIDIDEKPETHPSKNGHLCSGGTTPTTTTKTTTAAVAAPTAITRELTPGLPVEVEAIDSATSTAPSPNTNSVSTETYKNRYELNDQDELDIKQEFTDFFHAPHPPEALDTNRSNSSTDDNRFRHDIDPDEFAQDLRVSAASAVAKGLRFRQFALPARSLRHSSESVDESFPSLNMRKMNACAVNTETGEMLVNSLLSNETTPEENTMMGNVRGMKIPTSTGAAFVGVCDQQAAETAVCTESRRRDDCDFVGSNVSLKLRAMDRTQRIIAEKLISEVIFYGQFNELERSARIEPK